MTPLPKMVPHTAAKHLLLKRYLDRWFPILGKYNQRINYIDGFAGPGEYEDGEPGSPLLAVEAAKYHVEHGALAPNVTINFIFVEANPDYARHLQGKLDAMTRPLQFKARIIQGEFANPAYSVQAVRATCGRFHFFLPIFQTRPFAKTLSSSSTSSAPSAWSNSAILRNLRQ